MKRAIGLYLIVGIFSIFVWPRIFPPNSQRTFDEHSYTWMATQIREHGLGFLKSFTPTFLTDEQLKAQVPPNRALFPIYLAIATPKAVEAADFLPSIIVIQIAWLLLVGWICWKELGPNRGLIPFAFFSVSPFWLGTSGRIWVDWFFNFFIIAAFWNGLQWWRTASQKNLIFLNVCLILAALTKETIILYLMGFSFFLLYLTFKSSNSDNQRGHKIRGIWLSFFVGGATISLLLIVLAGNPLALLLRMNHVGHSNAWAHAFSVGPWFRYFSDEVMVNPVGFLLALAMLLKRDVESPFKAWRNWFWIIFLSFPLLPFKELRYIGHLELPIALALFYQLQTWTKKKSVLIALSCIVIACSLIHARFVFSPSEIDGKKQEGVLIGTSFELFQNQEFWNPTGK